MKRLARKKIVLVIVEGPSDEVALGMALSQVYDKDFIYVHIMHGDITTRRGVSSKNIVAKLGNEVTAYAKSQHYKASDFKQIIHIVDTDGAYIPDDNIMEKENLINNAAKVGEYLMKQLKTIPQIKEVRGQGLMIGLEFEQPVKELRTKLLFEQKVFTGVSGTNVIRLLPPLCLTKEQADIFVSRLKNILI